MYTVLVIDDEADVVDLISFNLKAAGYRALQAFDGIEGVDLAMRFQPEAIILDLMLPGKDGFKVFHELKADPRTRDIPVLMLSARAELADKITALKLGVDDYLTKPFSPRELMLRIQALLKWVREPAEGSVIRIGPFYINKAQLQCYLDGEILNLTGIEYKLFLFMIEHSGELMPRETILREVWGYSEGQSSRTLDTHLMRIREKFGPHADCLENIRGRGYRFIYPARK